MVLNIAKNFWLIKVKQILCIVVLTALLVQMLRYFSYYSKLPISFGEKFFYCVILDRVIAVILFAIKLPLCYDVNAPGPFIDGSLGAYSNFVYLMVWLSTEFSIWSVFFLFDAKFIYQLALVIGTVVLQLWYINYLLLLHWRKEEREQNIRRVLSGITSPLTEVEKRSLSNLGFRTSDKMIGFGCYGTTYECTSSMTGAKLALKVIDIDEWTRSRSPGTHPEEVLWLAHNIRNNYLRNVAKLRGLSHRNVVPFMRIHNEMNEFKRIYLITELAEMNLDKFLTEYRPNGVPEEWARDWFNLLCNGLLYLHNIYSENHDFSHSNIKPENILLFPKTGYEEQLRYQLGNAKTPNPSIHELRYKYDLKLSDCGFDTFMPLSGKVVTKRNPLIMISAPKKVVGKRNLRILASTTRNDTKKCDDIYQMGVILVLLLKGDITRLIKAPVDTEHIHNHVTGVDAIYVRFDKLEIIEKLFKRMDPSPKLIQLLRKMMEWEPLLRYDIDQVLDSDWMKQRD